MQISETYKRMNSKNSTMTKEISSDEYFAMCKEKFQKDKKNIIILDLDGTLINNLPRQEKIYENLMKNRLKLKEFPINAKDRYDLYYNIFESVGYYINNHIKQKSRFVKHFLGKKYLDFDEIIPKSLNFYKKLLESNFHIIILTGRHHKNKFNSMKKGTIELLCNNGFNLTHPNVELVMKPNKKIEDHLYKSRFVEKLVENPEFNLVSFIDNESIILNLVNKISPNSINLRFNGAQSKDMKFNGLTLIRW